jgi:acetyl esterase/lipase
MSRSVLVLAAFALALAADAETVEPRFPVPRHISKEAQAILAAPIQISRDAPPRTLEEWSERRANMQAMFRPLLETQLAARDVSITQDEIAGVTVFEVVPNPPAEVRAGQVLLHLHGGGYTFGGGEASAGGGIGLAARGHYRVVAADYRMPPEHPFPAAVDDGVAVYRALLESYEPENIAIFGGSAGGGLTAAVTLAARDAGLPLPGAVVMHTPWSDLSKTGDSYYTNEGVDPILPIWDGGLEASARAYAGKADLKHPLVSPVYADYDKGFPPALLSTGTRDLLLSCTVRLHRALRAAGVEAELHVFEAMWHGLATLPVEGMELEREVLAFLERHLGTP